MSGKLLRAVDHLATPTVLSALHGASVGGPLGAAIGGAAGGIGGAIHRSTASRALAGKLRQLSAQGGAESLATRLSGGQKANVRKIQAALLERDAGDLKKRKLKALLAGGSLGAAGGGGAALLSSGREKEASREFNRLSRAYHSPKLNALSGAGMMAAGGLAAGASAGTLIPAIALAGGMTGGSALVGRELRERAVASKIRQATKDGVPLKARLSKSQLGLANLIRGMNEVSARGSIKKRLAAGLIGGGAAGAGAVALARRKKSRD